MEFTEDLGTGKLERKTLEDAGFTSQDFDNLVNWDIKL